ncbi:MAG: hypothetical protein Q8P61_06565 [Candidatus Nanopelagicales bacterium]|nr:hypothetical protein [Candidatus Nanopelagicales bacterium]
MSVEKSEVLRANTEAVIAWYDNDDTQLRSPINTLSAYARLMTELEPLAGLLVRESRIRGASWQDIGQAMGISKQSAWERFSSIDEVDGN